MRILEAYKLAAELHTGQVDKAGRPYIEHLTRVFLRVVEERASRDQQVAALLHDSVEDGRATAAGLVARGVPLGAVELVQVLTKERAESYMGYLGRVKAEPRAVLIKVADVEDNRDPSRLVLLSPDDAQRLSLKYDRAMELLRGS